MSEARQKAGSGSREVDSPRRRWSEAQKRRIVAGSYRPGDSASAVAWRHGVHTSVLFKWRRRYGKPSDTGARFVPVVVEALEQASVTAPGRMETVLGEDVRVVVDATVHVPALARGVRRNLHSYRNREPRAGNRPRPAGHNYVIDKSRSTRFE